MKLTFGWGINNADYNVNPYEFYIDDRGGRERVRPCKIYPTWRDMLRRCYDDKYL